MYVLSEETETRDRFYKLIERYGGHTQMLKERSPFLDHHVDVLYKP